MRNVFFIPPLKNMSGGLNNIYNIVQLLSELGQQVLLCCKDAGTPGLAEAAAAGLNVVKFDQCQLASDDVWCVPESWPSSIAKGVEAGARTVVYAQSWVYMAGILPDELAWKILPVEYLAVSEPVGWFMRKVLQLEVQGILPPLVRPCFYREGKRPADRVRVAWMPRKNSAVSRQIQLMAQEFLRGSDPDFRLEWVAIQDMQQEDIAETFAACHIFLMSSQAEGFGLPPAEAMASGCIPVGFAGFGGWEYMRSSPLSPCHEQVCASLPPGLVLGDKAWGANGFYAPEGDVISAGMALAAAVRLASENSAAWQELQCEAVKTAGAYNREAMRNNLGKVWKWL